MDAFGVSRGRGKPARLLFVVLLCVKLVMISGLARSVESERGIHRDPLKATTQSGDSLSLYGGSHALLIGVSRYEAWPTLPSIPGELDALASVLNEQGFSVETLQDPDTQALWGGVQSFIRRHGYEPDNRLLIFFAGHGHSQGDKGFLLPANVPLPESREFRANALPMTQVMAWARDMEAKHALFLFDSCFSGTVFKSRNLPSAARRYIRAATSRPVRQFLTAGSADEEVPAKSTFTPALVDAIRGDGDLNGDGYVTGSELGVHLTQLLPQHVEQTPQYGTIRDYGLSRGDFVFFPGDVNVESEAETASEPEPSVAPEADSDALATVDDSTLEVLFWRSAERNDTAESYQAYLGRFPDGLFALLAKDRLKQFDLAADSQGTNDNDNMTGVADVSPASEEAQRTALQELERSLGLSRADRRGVQVALNEAGIDVGIADGLWGPKTREGLRVWQRSKNLKSSGFLDEESYRLIVTELSVVPVSAALSHQFSFLPEMIRIPAGRFHMGSVDGDDDERPLHQVKIGSFELGKYEVSFDQYDAFAKATGRQLPDDEGWGRGNRPVINVGWSDAKAYASWLSQETGETYRLPSESEWEYAARAGSRTDWSFGHNPDKLAQFANSNSDDGYRNTSPVGSFHPNEFGLYDMHGNVWEWTEDCWHGDYKGAPDDGSSWMSGKSCWNRVLRGGSWNGSPEQLRSANRVAGSASSHTNQNYVGFRIARTINP